MFLQLISKYFLDFILVAVLLGGTILIINYYGAEGFRGSRGRYNRGGVFFGYTPYYNNQKIEGEYCIRNSQCRSNKCLNKKCTK